MRSATRMPSANPTWASCGVVIRSPTADTEGTVVRHQRVHLDVTALDRDAGFLVAESAETGPRPTATSSRSASSGLPPSRVTVTPVSEWLTDSNRAPSSNPMPRRRNARCSSLDEDSSSSGSSWGSISTIVTSAPNDRHTLANSTPITPPPRMITAGTWSSTSA